MLLQPAEVSGAYHTRREQGNAGSLSLEVLDAISRALELSDAERTPTCRTLAKPKQQEWRLAPQRRQVRPALLQLLATMEGVPAHVWGRHGDVLAWNHTASEVFGDWAERAPQERNRARITFLDPAARRFFAGWESKASDPVGHLRLDAGQHPDDPLRAELIGEFR